MDEELHENVRQLICPKKTMETIRGFMPTLKEKQAERLQKNVAPVAIKLLKTDYKCKNCKNQDQGFFEEDNKQGQVTCKRCGSVIQERKIHDGEWKRQFSGEENPSFHGPAPDARYSDGYNMRTNIVGGTGIGAGSKVTKKQLMDLKNVQDKVEMNLSNMKFGVDVNMTRIGYKDKQKKVVFQIIDDVGGTLQLHDSVTQAAKGYFADYRDAMEQVQQRDAVTAACLLLALEEATQSHVESHNKESSEELKRKIQKAAASGSSSSSSPKKRAKTLTFEELHPFACKYCDYTFGNKKDLRIHRRACKKKNDASHSKKK